MSPSSPCLPLPRSRRLVATLAVAVFLAIAPANAATLAVELANDPARITIRDWTVEPTHEFQVSPATVTLYGTTVVPIRVRVVDASNDDAPVPDAHVVLAAVAGGGDVDAAAYGLTQDANQTGVHEIDVTTDEHGERRLFLRTDDLYRPAGAAPPTAVTVTARHDDDPPVSLAIPVLDNRQRILDEYLDASAYVPDGDAAPWRAAFLPPLSVGNFVDLPGAALTAAVQPGDAVRGPIRGSDYQSRTLVFLNDLRHSERGWLFNGLDYGPLQTTHTEHHVVALYPSSAPVAGPTTRILDPWLAQTPAHYAWTEFVDVVDPIGRGANLVPDARKDPQNPGTCAVRCATATVEPPPYPLLGGRYPFFPENQSLPIERPDGALARFDGCLRIPSDWCERNGLGGPARTLDVSPDSPTTVVVGSPVTFHIAMPDGRRFGHPPEAPETFVHNVDDFTTAFAAYPKPSGHQGWYIEVPARRFRVDLPAFGAGRMSVAILGARGAPWGGYRDVPVTAGTTVGFDVDLDAACPPLTLAGGTVPCTVPCTTNADCDDHDPCTVDGCGAGNVCTTAPVAGVTAAQCVCERQSPSACAGRLVPPRAARPARKACNRLMTALTATSTKKTRQYLNRAALHWRKARRSIGRKPILKVVGSECGAALQVMYTDGVDRAVAVRDTLPP